MSNRQDEITSFLKNAYNIKSRNNQKFSVKDIYLMLLSYDLDLDEFNLTYDDNYFSYFKEFYKNNININISDELDINNYFTVSNILDHSNLIKMYLNVSPDKYFTVLSKLIGFLSTHDEIKHYSKISKYSRSDQIVLGFLRKDDLLKVSEYILNTDTIHDYLRSSNPFLINNGVAFDFNHDYNKVISCIIYKYLEDKHDVELVKADDFVYFVRKLYNDLINLESFDLYDDFINSELFASTDNEDINKLLSDYLYILEEFYRLYEDDNFDLCYKLYEYSCLDKENEERYKYLSNKHELYNVKKSIDSYIKYAYSKYHDADEVAHRLSDYAKDSIFDSEYASRYITRDKGYRDLFKDISSDKLYRITNNDIYTYVDNIIRLI